MKTKIPKFKTIKEEAKFWDSHSVTDFLDELKPAHLEFPKPKHLVITLKPKQLEHLKQLASKQRRPCEKIVQKWIVEKLSRLTIN